MKKFILSYVSESEPINVEFFDKDGEKIADKNLSLAESANVTEAVIDLDDGESVTIS